MTPLDFSALRTVPRLLLEVNLKPIQGERFQPTGFADLGHAQYKLADGTEMLLVESAQSIANRLEAAVWDEANGDLIPELKGLPYIRIHIETKKGLLGVTTTLQEAHRLNSGYLWTIQPDERLTTFRKTLREALGLKEEKEKPAKAGKGKGAKDKEDKEPKGILDTRQIACALFKYDPNSILHGVFLTKLDGRMRITRAISGFIEARDVRVAESGGVKTDRVDPQGNPKPDFGMIPFHRTEYTAKAEAITAYFSLDLALLRGYGLGEAATNLLIALASLKVRRFLETGLRLRTACDFDVVGDVRVTRPPNGFALPATADLLVAIPGYIAACKELFPDSAITEVGGMYESKDKDEKKGESGGDSSAVDSETNDDGESEEN